jgi:hypothetical protein
MVTTQEFSVLLAMIVCCPEGCRGIAATGRRDTSLTLLLLLTLPMLVMLPGESSEVFSQPCASLQSSSTGLLASARRFPFRACQQPASLVQSGDGELRARCASLS